MSSPSPTYSTQSVGSNSAVGDNSSPLHAGTQPDDIARFLQRHGVQPLEPAAAGGAAKNGGGNGNGDAAAKKTGAAAAGASPVDSSTSKIASPPASRPASAAAAGAAAATSQMKPSSSSSDMSAKDGGSKKKGGGWPDDTEFVAWTDAYDSACTPVEGSSADLWSIDDYADEKDTTLFSYPRYDGGAGIARATHLSLLQSVGFDLSKVPFTPCRPYLKEPPPTNLPLESFDLRVIYDAGKTGFEDNKEFPITPGTIIAGRYKITEYIGSAAFSRAVQAIDLKHNAYVCVKIVRNSKDFFDQAMDEIKLLHYINCNGDPDENRVVQLYDFFYYKEHVFLVCELLRDNLYEFGKYNREHEEEPYFNLPRLQSITRQILHALAYVHSLNLLHADLKPENVLIKSYSRCEIKVIDFGSSCFTTDNLSSYIQSRCYRAPEVVLGCKYDGRIDIWSLGAMIPELATGHVLFHNDTLPQMLCRIAALLGPFPQRMVREGRHSCRYITRSGMFYELVAPEDQAKLSIAGVAPSDEEKLVFFYPKPRRLEEMCGYDDADYIDFIRQCLTVDHTLRPTAQQLLQHPFLCKNYGPVAGTTSSGTVAVASPKPASSPVSANAASAATSSSSLGASPKAPASPVAPEAAAAAAKKE